MKRILFLAVALLITGCEKFLNEKTDQKLITPSRIKDLQALLDNELLINQRIPRAAELSADDYYLENATWRVLNDFDKRMYIWEKRNLFQAGSSNDWGNAYQNVNYANIVLADIDKVVRTAGDQAEWDHAKGHALFVRGQAFLHIVLIWAPAYDDNSKGLGIPLKLDPDISKKIPRATLARTYEQIISDLKAAADLLPVASVHVSRPSRAAAYALLARTYLSMRRYVEMGEYASKCLQLKNTLKDFNTLNLEAVFPFAPRFSNMEEIITESAMIATPALSNIAARIDSNVFSSYHQYDLRKKAFFRNNGFRGSYTGMAALFSGISTSEVYLMRAESYARAGNISAAIEDLNRLLEKRFVVNTFVPLAANTAAEALSLILAERRKELIMRGLRWMDVKRLNKEGANITLKRIIDGKTYLLPPDDPGYALPIPEDVIRISGIEQNP